MTATLTTDKRQATGDINSVRKNKPKNVVISQGKSGNTMNNGLALFFGRLPSHSQTLQNLFLGKILMGLRQVKIKVKLKIFSIVSGIDEY